MIDLAALATAYVIAVLREYGGAVLNQAQADAAEATIGLARRLLQRIFGTRKKGEPLPEPLADVVADPQDENAVAALRLAIRKALAADPQLRADVKNMLVTAGVIGVTAGERSVVADSNAGIVFTGDNATISPSGLGGDSSGD